MKEKTMRHYVLGFSQGLEVINNHKTDGRHYVLALFQGLEVRNNYKTDETHYKLAVFQGLYIYLNETFKFYICFSLFFK